MASRSEPPADATSDADGRRLTDILLDALVYAPIGLTLDSQELTPELARRGRQHAAAARQIGEFAVKTGLQRLDGIIASRIAEAPDQEPQRRPGDQDAAEQSRADVDDDGTEAAVGEEPEVDDDEPTPSSSHLAIPDYDLLAASQVVRRLDGLDPEQLEAVRIYEAATRDRRTILHKIARLQS